MCGHITWGKRLVIALGLMLLTHVAEAGRIEKFTDSQGTLHITNLGSPKPENLAEPPNPGAPSSPSRLRAIPPVPPPAGTLVPEVQVPEPEPQQESEPGVVPDEPVPIEPQPGSG
jgi:hypothetical protein